MFQNAVAEESPTAAAARGGGQRPRNWVVVLCTRGAAAEVAGARGGRPRRGVRAQHGNNGARDSAPPGGRRPPESATLPYRGLSTIWGNGPEYFYPGRPRIARPDRPTATAAAAATTTATRRRSPARDGRNLTSICTKTYLKPRRSSVGCSGSEEVPATRPRVITCNPPPSLSFSHFSFSFDSSHGYYHCWRVFIVFIGQLTCITHILVFPHLFIT